MSRRRLRRRLLLASHDAASADALARTLVAQEYDVSLARSLSAARAGLVKHAYDLVLLDLDGNGESGLQLVRDIRAALDEVELPVLVLTATEDPVHSARALRAGANRTLAKPVAPAVLSACAEVVVGEAAVKRSARRERELVERLRQVEDALAAHEPRPHPGRERSHGPPPPMRPRSVYHTDEFAAAPAVTLERPGSDPAPAAEGGDTAEQVAVDWALFRVVEQALAQSLERRRPLSVLMVEALPSAYHDETVFVAGFDVLLDEALGSGGARIRRLESHVWCVVLPGAAETAAVGAARRLLGVVSRRAGEGDERVPNRVHVGVATLAPDFAGSPFRLLDQAALALQHARREGRSGWWVQRAEVAAPGG